MKELSWHRNLAGAGLLLAGLSLAQDAATPPKTAQEVLPLVNQYCGACHAVPRPDVQPRHNWPATVRIMVEITQQRTGSAQLSEAQMHDIAAYYYGSAPEVLPLLPYAETPPGPKPFQAIELSASSPLPMMTHISAVKLRGDGVQLLACDGESGRVVLLTRRGKRWREEVLAEIPIPVRTHVVDIDADKDDDILVADLGQFPPLNAPVGKLWLLRQTARGEFQRELLMEGLGRVSDARAADLDGDGDLDIAVAVFGGGDAGEVFWLERVEGGPVAGGYQKHELLTLSGAITVTPADLDADGKLDLLVLLAQEHEAILLFLNRGEKSFQSDTLARAPHPMYGSTSLTTADLDRDGDLDLIFTNGDAFDAQTDPKPYHGIQWLENLGGLRFAFHDLGRLYGAATVAAGDLDGDGDLDVVAGSWVNYWNDPQRYAVVWYENDGRQNFTARGIATRPAGVATLQLMDVNGDGALDIVTGAIRMDLMLKKLGSPYRAGRLFPPTDSALQPRIVVLQNPARAAR